MGRLAKITEGKSRHSLSQEVDFINKSLTKVNKAKLKEDRYASIDDELNAIENGGWDAFDNSDLADPIMADRIHQNASFEGRSDLDYVNHEDLLDDIEDDFAYEIEDGGNVNYAETPFRGFKDIFDEMKAELDADGEVSGSYGGTVTSAEDLVSYVLEMEIDAIYEEWGIRLPSVSNFPYTSIEEALKHLAPYANDTYPNCKGFFETLMNISQEYNATVTELNLDWPPLVRIPDQAGTLKENSVTNSLPPSVDNFLQDVAQMYGGIDYTDIMHFAKKATDAEVKKIQALSRKFKANADDEETAEGIAKQVASFVKDSLTESKRKPSKKALKEHSNMELKALVDKIGTEYSDEGMLADYVEEHREDFPETYNLIKNDYELYLKMFGKYFDSYDDVFRTDNHFKESKKVRHQKRVRESYDVSTAEGLAKYAKDLASSVLDGKLYDSNAVLAICATLHCNEDYAAECLDSWIETEQIRRSNLHMVPESKKTTKKRVKESAKLYDVLIIFENDGEDELFMNAAEELAPKGLYDGVSIWSDNHGAVQIYHVDVTKVSAFIEAAYDASFLSQIGCEMPREVRVYPEGELSKLFA